MLDFRQLRCFVALAEELHFGRAAKRLHMTQPPFSRQIQMLEHQIGTSLFKRDSRIIELSSAGRTLLPEARTILRLVENASVSARRVGFGEAGIASVGFTAAAAYAFLPELITRWRTEVPDVGLQLKEMVSREQMDAVEGNRLDFALLRPPVMREGVQSRLVVQEALVAALPVDHPLADGEPLTLAQFHHEPFVMYAPDEARYFHDLVADLFGKNEIFPEYRHYVGRVHSVLSLVCAGLGVSLVPHAALRLRYDGVVFREVTDIVPPNPVQLYMVWKTSNQNPALPRLLKTVSGLCESFQVDELGRVRS